MSTYVEVNGRAPFTEDKPGTAEQSDPVDVNPHGRRRPQQTERLRGDAARHRARAAELAATNIADGSAGTAFGGTRGSVWKGV